jgi:hypothetical protein
VAGAGAVCGAGDGAVCAVAGKANPAAIKNAIKQCDFEYKIPSLIV